MSKSMRVNDSYFLKIPVNNSHTTKHKVSRSFIKIAFFVN